MKNKTRNNKPKARETELHDFIPKVKDLQDSPFSLDYTTFTYKDVPVCYACQVGDSASHEVSIIEAVSTKQHTAFTLKCHDVINMGTAELKELFDKIDSTRSEEYVQEILSNNNKQKD